MTKINKLERGFMVDFGSAEVYSLDGLELTFKKVFKDQGPEFLWIEGFGGAGVQQKIRLNKNIKKISYSSPNRETTWFVDVTSHSSDIRYAFSFNQTGKDIVMLLELSRGLEFTQNLNLLNDKHLSGLVKRFTEQENLLDVLEEIIFVESE